MPSAGRSPKPSPMVVGGYLAYAAVGWYLSGLGSVLPELETRLGDRSAWYPLLPGAVLLVWGVALARRDHADRKALRHGRAAAVGVVCLAISVAIMGITRWFPVSALGAALAAVSAAWLIRLLPGTLAIERPGDTERVMMRANAWSSLAGIASPLTIGASIAIGLGWLVGMEVMLVATAVLVPIAARAATKTTASPHAATPAARTPVPSLRWWWLPWCVLALSIVVEFCFSYYAATYLHDEIGLSNAESAAGAAAWGIGMTSGRFALSAWTPPRTLIPSVVLVLAGFVLLWVIAEPWSAVIGIAVAGVGVSPLYPTRMTALIACFPAAPEQAATRGAVASGAALLAAPALMATLRAASDVRTAYLAVPVLLGVLVVLDTMSRRRSTQNMT